VELVLHLSMVEKKFRCPIEHAQRLVKVYKLLTSLHSTLLNGAFAAIKCKRMKVIFRSLYDACVYLLYPGD